MIQSIKKLAGKIFIDTHVFLLFRYLLKDKLTVLTFHNPNYEEFGHQIDFLCKWFNPVSEQDVINYYHHKKTLPINSVLITFDDGYENIKTFVEPILKSHGISALIFLPTSYISNQKLAWWDIVDYLVNKTKIGVVRIEERMVGLKNKKKAIRDLYRTIINRDEPEKRDIIKDLKKQCKVRMPKKIPERYRFINWSDVSSSCLDYGSHTKNHPILTNINREHVKREIDSANKQFKSNLGRRPDSFCYPNGDFNSITLQEVRRSGFKLGFSCNSGFNTKKTDVFALRRVGINKSDDTPILALKISGMFNILNRWRAYRSRPFVMLATNYYFPQLGGITTTVHSLHKTLDQYGIENTVFNFPNIFRKLEGLFSNHLLRRFIHRMLVGLYFVYGLVLIAGKRLRFKKVIVHGHSANFCAIYAYLGTFLGAKSVFTFHTDVRLKGFLMDTDEYGKRPFYLGGIDRLTAVSQSLKQQVVEYYSLDKHIDVIYNGLTYDSKNISTKKRTNDLLFVGNLISIKDPITYLKALSHLKKDFKALVIGTGDLDDQVQQMIHDLGLSKKVRMLGMIDHDEVMNHYQNSKVFVCSSIGEGLGNTIIEAASCGCRIVATNVGGIPEIGITRFGLGSVVPPRDPEWMAKAITKELKKKNTVSKQFLEKFNTETLVRKYIHIYNDLFIRKGGMEDLVKQ